MAHVVVAMLVLTGGGPGIATEALSVRMYNEAFVNIRMGPAASIAVIIFLINVAISAVYFRLLKAESHAWALRGEGTGTRRLAWRVVLYAFAAMTVSVVITPFLWEISTALKPENQLLARPPRLIPFPPTLEHFRHALERGVGRGLLNSLIVAGAASALTVGIGALAAYSLAVSVLTNLPVLLVFLALERRFIGGLSAGAIRG